MSPRERAARCAASGVDLTGPIEAVRILRPFSITSAVDTAFRLYGEHRGLFFSVSLLAAAPAAAGWLAVGAAATLVRAPVAILRAPGPAGATDPPALATWALFAAVALALTTLTSTVGIAASAQALSRLASGSAPTLGATVSRLVRAAVGLTLTSLGIAAVAIAGLALGVVPGLVLLAGTAFAGPVLLLERGGPVAAVRRSWRLTRGRRVKLAGTLGLCAVVVASTTGGLTAITVVAGVLGEGLAGTLVDALLTQAVAAAGAPVLYVSLALLYFDARVEIEGLDVLVVMAGSPASRGPGWSP